MMLDPVLPASRPIQERTNPSLSPSTASYVPACLMYDQQAAHAGLVASRDTIKVRIATAHYNPHRRITTIITDITNIPLSISTVSTCFSPLAMDCLSPPIISSLPILLSTRPGHGRRSFPTPSPALPSIPPSSPSYLLPTCYHDQGRVQGQGKLEVWVLGMDAPYYGDKYGHHEDEQGGPKNTTRTIRPLHLSSNQTASHLLPSAAILDVFTSS